MDKNEFTHCLLHIFFRVLHCLWFPFQYLNHYSTCAHSARYLKKLKKIKDLGILPRNVSFNIVERQSSKSIIILKVWYGVTWKCSIFTWIKMNDDLTLLGLQCLIETKCEVTIWIKWRRHLNPSTPYRILQSCCRSL